MGDFDGDGMLDLAVANQNSADVSVLLGNGDGSFQPARDYAAGGNPGSVAVGDFDGDGFPDLAVANGGVRVLRGNGDGSFQLTTTSYVAGSVLHSVAVGDFDGDGFPDLALASYNVFILLNRIRDEDPGNRPPVLAPNADRTIPATQDLLSVSLSATDPDGDPLSLLGHRPEPGLRPRPEAGPGTAGGIPAEDWGGRGEKWLLDGGGTWYFLLPDGELYRWDGGSQATGTLVGTPGASYHAAAGPAGRRPAGPAHGRWASPGSTLTIDREDGFVGAVVVDGRRPATAGAEPTPRPSPSPSSRRPPAPS